MAEAQFMPSNAGAQLVENQFRIAAGFSDLYARGQALRQSAEKFKMEQERAATEQALAQFDVRERANKLTDYNNQAELRSRELDAALVVTEAKKRQAKSDIDETTAAEALLAEMPTAFSDVSKIPADDVRGLMSFKSGIESKFGHLVTNPKFAARVAKAVGPHMEAIQRRLGDAQVLVETNALEHRTKIEDALIIGDEAGLAKLLQDPGVQRARLSPGENGKALNETISNAVKELQTRRTKLADENAAQLGREKVAQVAADARVKAAETTAGAGKRIPSELFSSTEKLINSAEDLTKIKETYDKDPELRGPFIGFVRDLNPWDSDAKLLAAKVQAAVPTLARGVFGEVGVLTDQDIANYKALLPNNRSPEAAAKVLFEFLSDKLQRSVTARKAALEGQGYKTDGFRWPGAKEQDQEGAKVTIGGITGKKVKGSDGKDYLVADDGTMYRVGQ